MEYKTHGVCAREIKFDLDGDTIKSVEKIVGGCSGNTQELPARGRYER